MRTIKEAIDEIQAIKWLIDEGPAHIKLTEAQTKLSALKEALTALSTIEPDEIRRECAEKVIPPIKQFLMVEEAFDRCETEVLICRVQAAIMGKEKP